ncbi:unnamed protein product [Rotaria sp. Silwood1]|nr:unnamed protein product [Rotaria sp. Silwood1]
MERLHLLEEHDELLNFFENKSKIIMYLQDQAFADESFENIRAPDEYEHFELACQHYHWDRMDPCQSLHLDKKLRDEEMSDILRQKDSIETRQKKINEKQKKLDEDLKNKTINETTAPQKAEEIADLIIIQSDSKIKQLDKDKENAIHDRDESAGNLASTTHHHPYDAHKK